MKSLRDLFIAASFALVSTLTLTGCPSDDGGEEEVGEEDETVGDEEMDTETDGTETSTELTAADVQPILDDNCVMGCHEPGGIFAGLDLTDAHASMVGVESSQAAGVSFVEASDSANSYVMAKILNTQDALGGSGSQMPLGGAALSEEDQATIKGWIDSGANP